MQVMEEFGQIDKVGFASKTQHIYMSVMEENVKFVWQSCQKVGNYIDFHLCDLFVLMMDRSLGIIPRKRAMKEVDETVGKGFQIVMAQLINT